MTDLPLMSRKNELKAMQMTMMAERGRHTDITYGDCFLTEASARLNGTDPMLWLA